MGFYDRNVFEVTDSIEGRVSEQAADFLVCPFDAVTVQKRVHGICYVIAFTEGSHFAVAVGKGCRTFAVVDADTCQRAEGDEGKAVFVSVEVRTFQQG